MLIPDNIRNFNSDGERNLYKKFKFDGSTTSMYVLHSVFTNHHIRNMSGELDFLVLAPNEGFFSIEVKHGGVSRKNGNWCFTNRYGKINIKKVGPFEQQSRTMNSIRNYVLKKIKHKKNMHDRFERILWGTGVALTSMTEFIDFGPEGHAWQVLTKQGLNLPIGTYISTLSKGSHREQSKKSWYDINQSRPTKKDCVDLIKILRGDFNINYSEINRINDIETQIEEYTQEQFALLDFVNYNPRCLIKGSAGTGKTLMALEIARRKSLEDIKIGLFCYNNRLGDKLNDSIQKMKLNKNRVIYSGTLHKYMKNHINIKNANHIGEPHKYFSEELPMEFLISNVDILEENKFDVLVLDEAQDLISPYFLEVFDLILKGGISNGNWIMFGDFSNQAIYLNNAANILELLNTYSSYTRFPPLKINCRNTKKIASQNTLLTGSELPEFTSKNEFGNNVISKYPNSTQQAIIIEEILQEIRNRKIPLNKVTLLSPKKMENSVIGNHYPILELIKKGVKTSTIQAYKGLENTIIVLYDFEEITSDKMKSLLYVGISRAKQELYIVLDKKLKVSVENLIEENYAKLNIHGNKR